MRQWWWHFPKFYISKNFPKRSKVVTNFWRNKKTVVHYFLENTKSVLWLPLLCNLSCLMMDSQHHTIWEWLCIDTHRHIEKNILNMDFACEVDVRVAFFEFSLFNPSIHSPSLEGSLDWIWISLSAQYLPFRQSLLPIWL